jgi:hypothetical protein
MTALRTLIAIGFRAFSIGDPAAPESIVYLRQHLDVRDMIRVYGPDECEAVRMAERRMVTQTIGTTPDVVMAVLAWPNIITIPGHGI